MSSRIEGHVRLPGSKSLTNRALMLAAQHRGHTKLTNASDSTDSEVVLDFLLAAGYTAQQTADLWQIEPPTHAPTDAVAIQLQDAGTALRFLTALCCTLPGTYILEGSTRLAQRPLKPQVDALRAAGAAIAYVNADDKLPIRIQGNPAWKPTSFTIEANQSSQFLSALLLLGPSLPVGCQIQLKGPLTSEPYARMTLGMLRAVGIHWQEQQGSYRLIQNELKQSEFTIESDWSAASYLLALASSLPAELQLTHLNETSLQGDSAQLELFRNWGLQCTWKAKCSLHVLNRGNVHPQPVAANFAPMPDLAQTFAVLAAIAPGASTLSGLHTLPLKETDRLAALVTELERVGVLAFASPGKLVVHGGALHAPPSAIQTYNDHRMAMSFAVLANSLGSIRIENPGVVRKSYPGFWEVMQQLGYEVVFS